MAIALGILAASGQVSAESMAAYEFVGELSLSGELRPVRGVLPAAISVRREKRTLVVPATNGAEAALAGADAARIATSLTQICAALAGAQTLDKADAPMRCAAEVPDICEVRGQYQAKRAFEIAAVGGHSLLMTGPPGSGKSMLAARLPGLLPPMSDDEAVAAASVASISQAGFDPALHWGVRPFRAPHHTASGVALVGGGPTPRPGEITLAHHGVLFLDELPEFERRVLEVLREPLESGKITISRAARQADFPAQFQLVAAMNPCPCGYLGEASGQCHCTADRVARYRQRISGPLLDRIDIHLHVARVPREVLTGAGEKAASSPAAQTLIEQAMDKLGLSARGYHRSLKVARSIADLDDAGRIEAAHISEALGYRQLADHA